MLAEVVGAGQGGGTSRPWLEGNLKLIESALNDVRNAQDGSVYGEAGVVQLAAYLAHLKRKLNTFQAYILPRPSPLPSPLSIPHSSLLLSLPPKVSHEPRRDRRRCFRIAQKQTVCRPYRPHRPTNTTALRHYLLHSSRNSLFMGTKHIGVASIEHGVRSCVDWATSARLRTVVAVG